MTVDTRVATIEKNKCHERAVDSVESRDRYNRADKSHRGDPKELHSSTKPWRGKVGGDE